MAREFRRRAEATEREDLEASRQRGDAVAQGGVQLRVCRYFVVVVEHQHERCLHARGELLEVATRECTAAIFRRSEVRQRRSFVTGRVTHRETEIVKEGRQVAIAFVELIPQMRQPLCFEVTAGERSLARTGRTADPDDRLVTVVEQLNQPGPRQHACVVRPRDLCGNRRRCGFGHHQRQRSGHTIA